MPPKKVISNPINTNSLKPSNAGNLKDFLANFVYDKNIHHNGYTNTRIGDRKLKIYGGTWNIPDDKYNEFLNLYYNEVILKKKKEYYTEKQFPDEGPIAIDLDFRHDLSVDERQYDINHIINFIDTYIGKIEQLHHLHDEDVSIPIYVFEKPKVNQVKEKNVTKDGIHIIIGMNCNCLVKQILRNTMLEEMSSVFHDIPMIDDWSWDSVFDEGVSNGTTGWQLFGSRKPGNDKYELTHIFNLTVDVEHKEFIRSEIPIQDFNIKDNLDKLSVRYHDHDSLLINETCATLYKDLQAKKHKKTTDIQIIQSANNMVSDFSFESIINNCNSKESIEKLFSEFLQNTSSNTNDYEIYNIARYVNILPKNFYGMGSYEKWIRVCWALKHASIEFGNPFKLFIVWLYFSSKSDTFDISNGVQECLSKWNDANMLNNGDLYKGYTRMSIYHWAKQYAREEYNEIVRTNVDTFIEDTLTSVDGEEDCSLANVMHVYYNNEFICTNTKTNFWYVWDKHFWKEDDGGNEIRAKITTELKPLYFKKSLHLFPGNGMGEFTINEIDDEDEKRKSKGKMSRCTKILQKCSNSSNKSRIHRELAEQFRDKDGMFMSNVDNNPYLFCCKNGVIDFKEKIFRDGRPDDYITKFSNIEYHPLTSENDHIVKEIHEFMNKLFPIPELCKYMWEHLASTLIGITPDQTFNIYIGEGQNGKSVLLKLMQLVHGNYKKDISTTVITDKKMKMGAASPEYAQLPGIRYLCMTESSETEEINEGIMKWLTGGDQLSARGLYEKRLIHFVPQFKMILACNSLPHIKATDHGTWRRIKAVPFLSLFTHNPVHNDKKKPYQFKIDTTIEDKFEVWAPVFLAMLTEIAFKTEGSVGPCKIVDDACRKYKNDSDVIAKFIEEKIVANPEARLNKTQLNQEFNIWYEDNNDSHDRRKKPTAKKLADAMIKQYGEPSGNVWEGIEIIEDNLNMDFQNELVSTVTADEL